MDVPVSIEIAEEEPENLFEEWDQVNECSITISSGKLVVAGCTDYFPDAKRINVPSDDYRARIYYGNLDSISEDGLDGDDKYIIVLWPSPIKELAVLKQREIIYCR